MPTFDDIPSSPPGPGTSLEVSLKFYKAQYELLEAELAEFQSSSKDLEAELERDIEAAEKRERQLKDKAANLQYEVNEWKEKYKQAKTEAGAAQNTLQREITQLRESNRELQMRLRDIEVANDDYERQQRNTESSLEGVQAQYNQTFEKSILLQQEVETGEQEREQLRIDLQRLRDELQDFRIEADINKEKLRKAEKELERRPVSLSLHPHQSSLSPRSDLSPTTTNTSTPSFDTPPAKTASSSGISDTPTPPSPPTSDRSNHLSKSYATPSMPKSRISMNGNTTPRQPTYPSRSNAHNRGLSSVVSNRTAPTSTYRQSLSKTPALPRTGNLPTSSSIMQLRNLRGKMQNLEQRVQKARSKLPGPIDTPPRVSPRSGSVLDQHIPSSVTVRSRKRETGLYTNGSLPDSDTQSTPSAVRTRPSRQSLTQSIQVLQQPVSPTRGNMAPPRPSSRASALSSRTSGFVPSHSRPGSRASISFRAPLGAGVGARHTPNASTDRIIRPQSSLSDYYRTATYDGNVDDESVLEEDGVAPTPTPRRQSTLLKSRTSDVGVASNIPTPSNKRSSLVGGTRLPGPARRQSHSNIGATVSTRPESRGGELRPPSRQSILGNLQEGMSYDVNETF